MWVIHTWPTVLHRVLEKKEPLRKGAEDDGVSHETRRRVVRAARCGSKASLRTERPSSHHNLPEKIMPREQRQSEKVHACCMH